MTVAYGNAAAPLGTGGAAPSTGWKKKDVADWSNAEVLAFLDTVLPGHPLCKTYFGHTTGRVLVSQSKEDLRKQARGDLEAAGVIWAELGRYRQAHEERKLYAAQGNQTIYVRTPADLSVEFEVEPTSTVGELKARLADTEGTPVELQRLTKNGQILLDAKPLAYYGISHGTVLLLVPRLSPAAATGGRANQSWRGPGGTALAILSQPRGPDATDTPKASGLPRPQVPIVCTEFARPFSMSLEFEGIAEYESVMLAIQRQVGRCDISSIVHENVVENAPCLEILPSVGTHHPVKTRVVFDAESGSLLVDTVGDILMERWKYYAYLHFPGEKKPVLLVTGSRVPEQ